MESETEEMDKEKQKQIASKPKQLPLVGQAQWLDFRNRGSVKLTKCINFSYAVQSNAQEAFEFAIFSFKTKK